MQKLKPGSRHLFLRLVLQGSGVKALPSSNSWEFCQWLWWSLAFCPDALEKQKTLPHFLSPRLVQMPCSPTVIKIQVVCLWVFLQRFVCNQLSPPQWRQIFSDWVMHSLLWGRSWAKLELREGFRCYIQWLYVLASRCQPQCTHWGPCTSFGSLQQALCTQCFHVAPLHVLLQSSQ